MRKSHTTIKLHWSEGGERSNRIYSTFIGHVLVLKVEGNSNNAIMMRHVCNGIVWVSRVGAVNKAVVERVVEKALRKISCIQTIESGVKID